MKQDDYTNGERYTPGKNGRTMRKVFLKKKECTWPLRSARCAGVVIGCGAVKNEDEKPNELDKKSVKRKIV